MAHGGLKDAARKIIMEDVFRPLHNKGEWKVRTYKNPLALLIRQNFTKKGILNEKLV